MHSNVQVFKQFPTWLRGQPRERVQQDAASVLQSLVDRGAQATFVLALGASAPAASSLCSDTALVTALHIKSLARVAGWAAAPDAPAVSPITEVLDVLGGADAAGDSFWGEARAAAGPDGAQQAERSAATPWVLTQPERYADGAAERAAVLEHICTFFDRCR